MFCFKFEHNVYLLHMHQLIELASKVFQVQILSRERVGDVQNRERERKCEIGIHN